MKTIHIESVTVQNGRRKINSVAELSESIKNIGLLNPITVTEDYSLIAGLHRLEACKKLGWSEIPAVVVSLNEIDSQLAEIDENLVRNELNALERSENLKRRKDLYEAKFPQTKNGMRNGQTSKNPDSGFLETPSFVADTVKKTGKSKSAISADVQIANRIPAEVRDAIRDTPLADQKTELLAMTHFDGDTQAKIAEQITTGKAAKVNDAINNLFPSAPSKKEDSGESARVLIQKVMSCLDIVKVINERDGGIVNKTKGWGLASRQELLAGLEMVCRTYGDLAAELGDSIENEK